MQEVCARGRDVLGRCAQGGRDVQEGTSTRGCRGQFTEAEQTGKPGSRAVWAEREEAGSVSGEEEERAQAERGRESQSCGQGGRLRGRSCREGGAQREVILSVPVHQEAGDAGRLGRRGECSCQGVRTSEDGTRG